MEMILFVGVQGSGKSSFYKERFFQTHVRINLDMLRTRHREQQMIETCLAVQQPLVIDNTNVKREERVRYIHLARTAGFQVRGYFFNVSTREAIARNNQRAGRAKIPVPAILGTFKRLQPPQRDEGFDELFQVTLDANGGYVVAELSGNPGTA